MNAIEAFGRPDVQDFAFAPGLLGEDAGTTCGSHSHASGDGCACDAGYVWVSDTSNDCVLGKTGGGSLAGAVAGVAVIALVGTAVVGGAVGAGVAAAMAKSGQKPAYLKGAVIGAGTLFGAGLLYGAIKK